MKNKIVFCVLAFYSHLLFAQPELGSSVGGGFTDDRPDQDSGSDGEATIGSYHPSSSESGGNRDFIVEQLGVDIDGEAEDDRFGWFVSMDSDGDRVAVGAPYNDGAGSNAGHVRVYEYNNGSWSRLGRDIDGEAASDYSGWSVSIDSDGDRVAIGAYWNDGTGSKAGHARVYEYSAQGQQLVAFNGMNVPSGFSAFVWGGSTLEVVESGGYNDGTNALKWVQGDEWENGWTGTGFNIDPSIDLASGGEWATDSVSFFLKADANCPELRIQFESGEDGKVGHLFTPETELPWPQPCPRGKESRMPSSWGLLRVS
mgnify:CR=1 FL=1